MRTGSRFGIIEKYLEFPVADLRQIYGVLTLVFRHFRVCCLDLEGKLKVSRFHPCPASDNNGWWRDGWDR